MTRKGPESKFRKAVCDALIQCNAKIYPIMGGLTQVGDRIYGQNPGMSDIIMVHRFTGIIFLEFKARDGRLGAAQKRFLQDVNERVPYSGFVVRECSLDTMGDEIGILESFEDGLNFGSFSGGLSLINLIRELRS